MRVTLGILLGTIAGLSFLFFLSGAPSDWFALYVVVGSPWIFFFWLIFVLLSEIDPKINFRRAAAYAACALIAIFLFSASSCLSAGCPNARQFEAVAIILAVVGAATVMFLTYWLVALRPKVRGLAASDRQHERSDDP